MNNVSRRCPTRMDEVQRMRTGNNGESCEGYLVPPTLLFGSAARILGPQSLCAALEVSEAATPATGPWIPVSSEAPSRIAATAVRAARHAACDSAHQTEELLLLYQNSTGRDDSERLPQERLLGVKCSTAKSQGSEQAQLESSCFTRFASATINLFRRTLS